MEDFYLRIEVADTSEVDLPAHVITITNVSTMFSNINFAQNRDYLYRDTLQELKTLLVSQSLKHFLEKESDLPKKERGRVIRLIADAMIEKYGASPPTKTLKNYASALNRLFPLWKQVYTQREKKYIQLHLL